MTLFRLTTPSPTAHCCCGTKFLPWSLYIEFICQEASARRTHRPFTLAHPRNRQSLLTLAHPYNLAVVINPTIPPPPPPSPPPHRTLARFTSPARTRQFCGAQTATSPQCPCECECVFVGVCVWGGGATDQGDSAARAPCSSSAVFASHHRKALICPTPRPGRMAAPTPSTRSR